MTDDLILFQTRHERLVIAALCLAAAVRVFIFSAAFPFFNNVDETFHFDLVFKYSRGHLPVEPLEKMDPEAVRIIVANATGEYAGESIEHSPEWVADSIAFLEGQYNLETWAWPAYYMLAGLWCWLGKTIGLGSKSLLYWIRFLNVPLATAFVWLSWLFSRRVFGKNVQQRIALPLIVAFFPQDTLFAITADVLSPLVFAAAFFMLLEIYLSEKSWRYHLFTGLVVAATFLTKVSNIAILVLAAAVYLIKMVNAVRQNSLKSYLPSLAAFSCATTIPIVFWLGRNYLIFGDITGAAWAMKARTWTRKPFNEMFNHPIFSLQGAFFFLIELTKTFWRGEFVWGFKRLASPLADWFYCLTSAVFSLAFLAGFIVNRPKMGKSYRRNLAAALFVVALSVMLLAVLSMRYDFGYCLYPSREHPYFTSGRLIAGIILPFLLLYIDGLQRILTKLHLASYLLIVVGVIAITVTISEIILSLPAFASPFNLFHIK
jgi:hypothetical protein